MFGDFKWWPIVVTISVAAIGSWVALGWVWRRLPFDVVWR